MFISPRFRVLLLVAIILTLLVTIRRVFLKYPVIFYAPGLVFDIFKGTDPYTPIKWKESVVSSSSQPNIVFIIADDLGFNDLSGNTDVATPNIDSIAKSGATFTTAYAGHATCSPSRAAILTGRYATRMGFEYTAVPTSFAWVISRPQRGTLRDPVFHSDLIRNVPPMANMIVPLDEVMVSNVLKDLNYSTTYVGKWHLGESEGARPEQRGYEESLSFLQGASLYYPLNHPDVINAPLGSPLDDFLFGNLRHVIRFNGGRQFQPTAYMTDYLATEAANSIRDKCASPFFLTVAFNAPHNPLQASKEDFESPDIAHITDHTTRVYAAMIKALDRGVGTILTAIEECGKTENTLVVFTSDNGGPGTLGQVSNSINAPYRGWKATFFEGGIRVPLFMSWPRVIPRGSIYHKPVSHVDLFATAVVAGGVHNMTQLGLDLRRDYDGVNLLDFIGNFEVPDENISPAEVVPDTGVAPGSPALIYADGVDRAGKSPSVSSSSTCVMNMHPCMYSTFVINMHALSYSAPLIIHTSSSHPTFLNLLSFFSFFATKHRNAYSPTSLYFGGPGITLQCARQTSRFRLRRGRTRCGSSI